MAILSESSIVNQGSPLGATVIPKGPLPLTAFDWVVITPSGVIRAMFPASKRVNHIEPSAAGAMSSGPPSTGNNLTSSALGLGAGLMRPTACENLSVNHTAPSLAMLISRGKPSTSISLTTPVVGSSRPIWPLASVNYVNDTGATVTSRGTVFGAGSSVKVSVG